MITVHDLRRVSPDTVEAWADHLAANLRQSDIDEIAASSAIPPGDALRESIKLSTQAWVIESDTLGPVAVFGVAPHPLPGVGIAWMLGTDGLVSEAFHVARQTRKFMEELNRDYWLIWNFIDARNAVSLRWLRWGGFKLLAEHPNHGPEGRPFYTFARTAQHV